MAKEKQPQRSPEDQARLDAQSARCAGLRRRAGMTYKQVAAQLGIFWTTWRQWEKGERLAVAGNAQLIDRFEREVVAMEKRQQKKEKDSS